MIDDGPGRPGNAVEMTPATGEGVPRDLGLGGGIAIPGCSCA